MVVEKKLVQTQHLIETGLCAWQSWNEQGVIARAELIAKWAEIISQEAALGKLTGEMAKYQKHQAITLLGDEKLMPGPTGEVNELYSAGRGLFIVAATDAEQSSTINAIVGHVSAALLAGNTLVLALPQAQQALQFVLLNTLHAAGIPELVVQGAEETELTALIESPKVAGVAFTGDEKTAQMINRTLSTRDGLLAQLVAEVSGSALAYVTDDHFILRFITERTRTINITAVGGNAILLELGGGDH